VDDDLLALNNMLEPLIRYSFIRLDRDLQTYSIHRLVQEVLKGEMDVNTYQLWTERAVRALDKAFPYIKSKDWPIYELFLPHAKAVAKLIEEWDITIEEARRVINLAAAYCYARGEYAEAEPLYKRSLTIWQKALGPDHPNVAIVLENYAVLLRAVRRDKDAEEMEARAAAIRAKHARQNSAE